MVPIGLMGLKIPKSYSSCILDARFTLRHCAIMQDSSNWASTLFAKRVWLGCSINDFGIEYSLRGLGVVET